MHKKFLKYLVGACMQYMGPNYTKELEILENTIDLMLSDDYVDRLKAEYIQTKIRYKKLKEYNTSVTRDYVLGREVDDKVRRTQELYVDQAKVIQSFM